MNIMLTVDAQVKANLQTLPKNMSASRLVRHLVRAFTFSDVEWSEYAKTLECKQLKAFISPYKRRLGWK